MPGPKTKSMLQLGSAFGSWKFSICVPHPDTRSHWRRGDRNTSLVLLRRLPLGKLAPATLRVLGGGVRQMRRGTQGPYSPGQRSKALPAP